MSRHEAKQRRSPVCERKSRRCRGGGWNSGYPGGREVASRPRQMRWRRNHRHARGERKRARQRPGWWKEKRPAAQRSGDKWPTHSPAPTGAAAELTLPRRPQRHPAVFILHHSHRPIRRYQQRSEGAIVHRVVENDPAVLVMGWRRDELQLALVVRPEQNEPVPTLRRSRLVRRRWNRRPLVLGTGKAQHGVVGIG